MTARPKITPTSPTVIAGTNLPLRAIRMSAAIMIGRSMNSGVPAITNLSGESDMRLVISTLAPTPELAPAIAPMTTICA